LKIDNFQKVPIPAPKRGEIKTVDFLLALPLGEGFLLFIKEKELYGK